MSVLEIPMEVQETEQLILKVSDIISIEPSLNTKSVTQNGIYKASDDNLDGYSQVNVNVPQPSGSISITADVYQKTVDVSAYTIAKVTNFMLETMDAQQIEIAADSETISINYDSTKNVAEIIVIRIDNTGFKQRDLISYFYRYTEDHSKLMKYSTYTSSASESGLAAVPEPVFDSDNGIITLRGSSSTYQHRAGNIYLAMVAYYSNT